MLKAHMHECEIFLFLALYSDTSPVPRSVTSLSKDQYTVSGNIPYPQAITEIYTDPYWSDLVLLQHKNTSSLAQTWALDTGGVTQR